MPRYHDGRDVHGHVPVAKDNVGHTRSATCACSVVWDFSGFFQPVDDPEGLNVAKAGSAIPVKFSLAGDQGLQILSVALADGTTHVAFFKFTR